jgi:hypothetical protein
MSFEIRRIEFLGACELPIDGPELFTQFGQALLQKAFNGFTRPRQFLAVGAKARGFHREHETGRRLFAPLDPALGLESGIICAVDLDGGDGAAREFQLPLLG